MRKPRYSDWVEPAVAPEPEPEKASSDYVDAPEPDPWTLLMPLFGVQSWTPDSPCPHKGPLAEGSVFVCMKCHAAGKDGTKALPLNVAPLAKDPAPPEPEKPKQNRKQKRAEAFALAQSGAVP